MPSRLVHSTLGEKRKIGRVLGAVTARYSNPKRSRESLQASIAVLESAIEIWPQEWIYWYVLADYYNCAGQLVSSFRACQKCNQLRPKDPRSLYAIASSLRILTRAQYLGHPQLDMVRERLNTEGPEWYDFNPQASSNALQELGLTIDNAAWSSMLSFERLRKKVWGRDAAHLDETLAAMYSDFPHLTSRSPPLSATQPLSFPLPNLSRYALILGVVSAAAWSNPNVGLAMSLGGIVLGIAALLQAKVNQSVISAVLSGIGLLAALGGMTTGAIAEYASIKPPAASKNLTLQHLPGYNLVTEGEEETELVTGLGPDLRDANVRFFVGDVARGSKRSVLSVIFLLTSTSKAAYSLEPVLPAVVATLNDGVASVSSDGASALNIGDEGLMQWGRWPDVEVSWCAIAFRRKNALAILFVTQEQGGNPCGLARNLARILDSDLR